MASKKASNLSAKNKGFIESYLEDLRAKDEPKDVHLCRVLKKLGDGRVELFYLDVQERPQIKQGVIRGAFRGKGKHSVWIDPGSIVLAAETGISGSASLEIMAVLQQSNIDEIRKVKTVDSRIVDIVNTDGDRLKNTADEDDGFMFQGEEMKDEDIDQI